MKACPKCSMVHEKQGLFCSRSCANSRTFTDKSKEKKRKAMLDFYSDTTEAQRKEINAQKMLKYDKAEAQRKTSAIHRAKSWSRPHEEMAHDSLRRRLLVERNHTCEECGISNVYNGKPLSLELDHIDGNNVNNKIENLRILCPNCHSQTPTHRAKNIRYKKLNSPRAI